ncbi:hypothetical protein CQA53_07435 [Helicobacter didelphidarum]|uniref:Motility integral membrane protein n=1 Tax=Helicobacter didelphidarum TaxID=2040648 RepID=A0A3D8IJQ1_9HELI|nr:hypothetical protein [Helicobacter didelphidarum]RDU64894.1 hypothetical protein CQA53_07435 [Helicobacter didelphidarum]
MLKRENYVSFAIVVGFFLGLVFGVAKFDEPELMVLWTILSTMGIYLIVTVSVSVYYIFTDSNDAKLHKEKLEESLEHYRKEFDRKEQEVESIRNFIKSLQGID